MIRFGFLGATTHIIPVKNALPLNKTRILLIYCAQLSCEWRQKMTRGSKDKYTAAQKKKAAHIEQDYEEKGTPKKQAEAIAWATVNKQSGGGEKKGGSGQTTPPDKKQEARKSSARRAAATKRGEGPAGNSPV
jgi:hypothetical protein